VRPLKEAAARKSAAAALKRNDVRGFPSARATIKKAVFADRLFQILDV